MKLTLSNRFYTWPKSQDKNLNILRTKRAFFNIFKGILFAKNCLRPESALLRTFQDKILNDFLYINKKLFQFEKCVTPLCSFCKNFNEKSLHIFCKCEFVNFVWNKKAFLEISHNSQENTCARVSFLIKLQA